jgi:hypothetical protein
MFKRSMKQMWYKSNDMWSFSDGDTMPHYYVKYETNNVNNVNNENPFSFFSEI